MADSSTAPTPPPDSSPAPGKWARLKPWIVPTATRGGWKSRLRMVAWRIVFYYGLLVVLVAYVQRDLIYIPGRAETITAADAQLFPGMVHDVVATTSDGIELHGWHVLPPDQPCQDLAECDRALAQTKWLVLYFHGNGGDRRRREFDCQTFASSDATVLLFDYRGYGDNKGKPTQTGLVNDARAVWSYATQQRNVPHDRIIIYGESLGGGVAAQLCRELCAAGERPAGLVLGCTFSSLADAAAHHYPFLPVNWMLLDPYRSDQCMPMIDCPVLQVHCRGDGIVPFSSGRRLFETIPSQSANGIPKQFVEFSSNEHNNFPESKFRQAVANFFKLIAAKTETNEAPSRQ